MWPTGGVVECWSKHLALKICTMTVEFHLLVGERFMQHPERRHPGMTAALFGGWGGGVSRLHGA